MTYLYNIAALSMRIVFCKIFVFVFDLIPLTVTILDVNFNFYTSLFTSSLVYIFFCCCCCCGARSFLSWRKRKQSINCQKETKLLEEVCFLGDRGRLSFWSFRVPSRALSGIGILVTDSNGETQEKYTNGWFKFAHLVCWLPYSHLCTYSVVQF